MQPAERFQPTILVVDDEATVCQFLAKFFAAEGFRVLTAESGEAALRLLSNGERVKVVLLDIRMPGIGGMETLRQIRANHPRVGVIMVTAQVDGDLAREALQHGAHDYITKPLDLRYLRTSVLVRVLLLVED